MNDKPTCPKCSGEMVEGYLLEFSSAVSTSASQWVAGEPERSRLSGTKVAGKERYPIRSYRCVACGYLESYARPA